VYRTTAKRVKEEERAPDDASVDSGVTLDSKEGGKKEPRGIRDLLDD